MEQLLEVKIINKMTRQEGISFGIEIITDHYYELGLGYTKVLF